MAERESALRQAKAAAGDRDVIIGGGANIAQQFLQAGLVDEIQLHLVPKVLGQGMRLFDQFSSKPVELKKLTVIDAPDVTHITFRVSK